MYGEMWIPRGTIIPCDNYRGVHGHKDILDINSYKEESIAET